jgi:hypothetical protein
VTMHVVLGDGEMPRKELTETLQDLWDKATTSDETFWFLVQAKPEPTATDTALMSWVAKNEIYYETIGDGSEVDEIYDGAQDKHTAKRLATKIANLMNSKPEEGETADVLALFASDDPEAEEDRWLNETIQVVIDAGYPVLALNDGLVEVDLSEAPEPDEVPAPAKTAAKKAAAPAKKAAVRAATPEEEAEDLAAQAMSREALEDMTLDQLKEIASNRGISLPPRTRAGTYIDAILGEAEPAQGEVEVGEVAEIQDDTTMVGAPAILVVMYNGTVTSKAITVPEAEAILAL